VIPTEYATAGFVVAGEVVADPSTAPAQEILARAHRDRVRPLCLCQPGGVAMYTARAGAAGVVVKRMPETGWMHAPSCSSYAPPPHLSGLGQVWGQAIRTDVDTDLTMLRLGFALTQTDRVVQDSTGAGDGDSVEADPARLSLRGLLHCLWEDAGLASWSPRMAGKRNWRVVGYHVRKAAGGKIARGKPLADRLWVPEPFSAERKAEMSAARMAAWAPLRAQSSRSTPLLVLVGEFKAFEPGRFGPRLFLKHMPDAGLNVEEATQRRFERRFAAELEMLEADDGSHLMVIATASIGRTGTPTLVEASAMLVDEHWLPYESAEGKLLLEAASGRRFTVPLRYNLARDALLPTLILTDTTPPTACYALGPEEHLDEADDTPAAAATSTWSWQVTEPLPALPDAATWSPSPR